MKIKATFLIFTSCLMMSNLFAQDINQKDASGRKQGEWVVKYENSTVAQYKGQYKDDKPYGTFTYYYTSNKVKAVMKFDKDGKTSRIVLYHENGQPMGVGNYVNKLKDSVWTQYGPTGKISYKETYRMGVLDGPKTIYYVPADDSKTLQIAQEYVYVNGKLEGPVKEYFPNGVLKMKGMYKNEHFEGEIDYYNPSGTLSRVDRYKNNLKHGWQIAYNDKGVETNRLYFYKNKELKGEELKAKMAELKASGTNPNN